jgi:hypothetical protein
LEALETKRPTLIPELPDLNADLLPGRPNAMEDWPDVPWVLIPRHASKVRAGIPYPVRYSPRKSPAGLTARLAP